MSIRSRRNDIRLFRRTEGGLGNPDTLSLFAIFKGRIDKGTTASAFQDGKITRVIVPTLFCDVAQEFRSNDIIEDINGDRYAIARSGQPDGVSGIKPLTFKAHKEIRLIKSNA